MSERIILFPGLGADRRVFNGIPELSSAVCVDYHEIEFNRHIDLVLSDIKLQYDIKPTDILISTSFGSFIAGLFENQHISIGGLTDKKELSFLFRMGLKLKFYKYLPISLAPKIIIKFFFGIQHKQTAHLFFEMLDKYSHEKLCSMLDLIHDTKFSHQVSVQIHGRFDKIISKPKKVNHWSNFGHIASMEHHITQEAIEFIHLATK